MNDKSYGEIVVITGDEIIPNAPLSEHEELALMIYGRALRDVAHIIREREDEYETNDHS